VPSLGRFAVENLLLLLLPPPLKTDRRRRRQLRFGAPTSNFLGI